MTKSLLNAPTLSIIAPTYNERRNIRPLVKAVGDCMGDTPWELIFVDDDSPDGTRARDSSPCAGGSSSKMSAPSRTPWSSFGRCRGRDERKCRVYRHY